MNKVKILAYQYTLKATREKDKLVWETPTDLIDKLFLGFPWAAILDSYNNRCKFYYGFSVSGHGDEMFAVIDSKIELSKASLTTPEFLLEVAVCTDKCAPEHKSAVMELLEGTIQDPEFKVWWEHDRRGPRKRKPKDKEKILQEVKDLGDYDGVDDLKLEDVEVTIKEALEFFDYPSHIDRKEARKSYKIKYRKLQLEHHPDSETGNEEKFLYLQKCRKVLDKWIRW